MGIHPRGVGGGAVEPSIYHIYLCIHCKEVERSPGKKAVSSLCVMQQPTVYLSLFDELVFIEKTDTYQIFDE